MIYQMVIVLVVGVLVIYDYINHVLYLINQLVRCLLCPLRVQCVNFLMIHRDSEGVGS